MLCQFTADACARPVVAGPVEATALGNVMMQAIGTGRLNSIDDARALVRSARDIVYYEPTTGGFLGRRSGQAEAIAIVKRSRLSLPCQRVGQDIRLRARVEPPSDRLTATTKQIDCGHPHSELLRTYCPAQQRSIHPPLPPAYLQRSNKLRRIGRTRLHTTEANLPQQTVRILPTQIACVALSTKHLRALASHNLARSGSCHAAAKTAKSAAELRVFVVWQAVRVGEV
ncbi:MAG: hypothetical protein R3C56_22645 [Pirellulaceae bacterium]